MSIQYYRFTIHLTLAAPFLSHKSGAQRFGYDMSMLRDAEGVPVFLGSQIRGNLLHTLNFFQRQLQDANQPMTELDSVISYFGKPSDEESEASNAPQRAKFNFSYYWTLEPDQYAKMDVNTPPRFRIGIDASTGTTVKGNLQVIESLFAGGTDELKFCGNVTAQLSEKEALNSHVWLSKALNYLPAIGALKGTGFGRIKAAKCTYDPIPTNSLSIARNKTDRLGICLKIDRPFCIAKPHLPNSNRFVSEDFIPGNAIIGAMAQQYPKLTQDQAWFNKIHIRHAFATPVTSIQRTAVLPLSLAFYDEQLLDLANTPEPEKIFLIEKDGKFYAPAFQPDWKHKNYCQAHKAQDRPKTSYQRHLVVRTAINEKTNQAKDEALFSLECIEPKDDVWYTEINLSRLEESEKVHAIDALKQILAYPLCGIGKTKATAEFTLLPEPIINCPEIKPLENNRYIITLQTQARLFAEPENLKATGDKCALKKLYADYWHEKSDGQLSLSHYFAQQARVGGEFYWRHYRDKQTYQPEWLTQPGSVFVLQAAENSNTETIRRLLKDWQELGLPPASDRDSDTWQTDPFIRENGFGEIRVNEAIHIDFANYAGGEWL